MKIVVPTICFTTPSILQNIEHSETPIVHTTILAPTWMTPYVKCLAQGILPIDKDVARKIATKFKSYVL